MESSGSGGNGLIPIRIAMFPWFAFGHINPYIHLSNNLLNFNPPSITIFFLSAPANIPRIAASLFPTAHIIPLDVPLVDGLPPGVESTAEATPHQRELLKLAVDEMKPQVEALLLSLNPHVIFHDSVHHWLPSLAHPLNIKTFFSIFSSAPLAYVFFNPARLPPSSSSQDAPPTLEHLKKPPPGFPSTSITHLRTFEARDLLYCYQSFLLDCVFVCMVGGVKFAFDQLLKILARISL